MKTLPLSVFHPGSVESRNLRFASTTRLQYIRRYSFSNVPGVGSRLAQKAVMNRARSGTVFRCLISSYSLEVMR